MAKPSAVKEDVTSKIKNACKRNEKMKQDKQVFMAHWQTIGEYFLTRKAIFTSTRSQGAFLNDDLFDSTGPGALMKSAAAILGMAWPDGANSFAFERLHGIPDSEEIKTYYERIQERMAEHMDNPRAGLQIALDECLIDELGFGTGGISVMPGTKTKLQYKAENVKFMCIDEGPDGFVDTVYIEYCWTIRQAVLQYGLENLHPDTQKLFNEGKEDEEIEVLFCVQPRMKKSAKEGVNAMDFESLHIELKKKHLIKEGGFTELPVKVARFRKALNEIYGRSPAMEALPDVQSLNAAWEGTIVAIEKMIDPPLYVMDDGTLGSNEIDTSAGAINVLNISGRAGQIQEPIKPLYTVEEITSTIGLIERLEARVSDHFMLDRLLDFNNQTEMTLGEANIRNRIRGFLLGSMFARQIAELFNPLIERTFNLLFEMGEMGVLRNSKEYQALIAEGADPNDIIVIPDAIANRIVNKQPPFKIKYISPVARVLQSEKAQAIIQEFQFILQNSTTSPELGDIMKKDKAGKELGLIWGVPSKLFNSEEEIQDIRDQRDQMMKEKEAVQAAPQIGDTMQKMANANRLMMPNGKKAA